MVRIGAEEGYQNASVERVIGEAGLARSTFYQHFSDKEACFCATLQFVADEVRAKVESDFVDMASGLQGAVVALLAFAGDDRAAARVLFVESLAAGPGAAQIRAKLAEQIGAAIEDNSADRRRLGVAPQVIVGAVFRLLAMRLMDGEVDEGLGEGLKGWIDSYQRADPSLTDSMPPSASIEPLPGSAMPSLESLESLADAGPRKGIERAQRRRRDRTFAAVVSRSGSLGYAQVTVAEITKAAQISRKAFYEQFRDTAEAATQANQRFFQAAMTVAAGEFFAAPSWPERIWAAGVGLLSFLALHPEESYLAFVETHAVGGGNVGLTYQRLSAFTLFLEEGYSQRPEAGDLSRVSSEALKATMFEIAYQELRERRSAEQLLFVLPRLAYVVLAPFIGPEAAAEFVAGKVGSAGSGNGGGNLAASARRGDQGEAQQVGVGGEGGSRAPSLALTLAGQRPSRSPSSPSAEPV